MAREADHDLDLLSELARSGYTTAKRGKYGFPWTLDNVDSGTEKRKRNTKT